MGEDGKADGGWCLARRLIAIDVILAARCSYLPTLRRA